MVDLIENMYYKILLEAALALGLTWCAERVALASAVGEDQRQYDASEVVADANGPLVPCVAFRQFMAGFNPALTVVCRNMKGREKIQQLGELLPELRRGIL